MIDEHLQAHGLPTRAAGTWRDPGGRHVARPGRPPSGRGGRVDPYLTDDATVDPYIQPRLL